MCFFICIKDEESGTCSLYEFIYSFRNSPDAEYPDPLSQESINSLKMLKEIMNEVSSGIKPKTI